MEASDTFAQEINDHEDPFAESDFGDFGQPEEGATEAAPEAALPVVNAEGERVDAPDGPAPAQEATEAPAAPSQVGPTPEAQAALDALKPDPTLPAGPPAESAGPTEEPVLAEAVAGSAVKDPQPAEAGTTASAVEPSPTTPPSGEATQDPTPGSSPEQPPSNGNAAVPGAAREGDGEEVAPVPEEIKDKNDRVTKRRYLIFQVEGPGKLTQVQWYEDEKGKLVPKGPGTKRQNVVLARGTDDALKFGYAAIGSPEKGAQLVAVAALHFQPKKIKPMPPEPMRQRLSIS